MISPFKDYYRYHSYNPITQPFKKCADNFKIAISKNDPNNVQEPISLCKRISFVMMAGIYSIPIINTIVYIALDVILKDKPLSYEKVIDMALSEFKDHECKDDIINNIKKRLDDCQYIETVQNGKKPHIYLDYREDELDFLGQEDMIKYESIRFIKSIPVMKIHWSRLK